MYAKLLSLADYQVPESIAVRSNWKTGKYDRAILFCYALYSD